MSYLSPALYNSINICLVTAFTASHFFNYTILSPCSWISAQLVPPYIFNLNMHFILCMYFILFRLCLNILPYTSSRLLPSFRCLTGKARTKKPHKHQFVNTCKKQPSTCFQGQPQRLCNSSVMLALPGTVLQTCNHSTTRQEHECKSPSLIALPGS